MEGGLLSLKWNNHRSSFIHVLSSLRKKDSFCDVTLTCEGKFYPSHKFVLSTCSDYFQDMFQHTECKHPIIVLKDIKSEDLEALLNYMYVGEVNVVQEKLSSLIKSAECLRIKGLAVPDDPPKDSPSEKRNSSQHDGQPESKRRRSDHDHPRNKEFSKSSKSSSKSSDNFYRSNTSSHSSFNRPRGQFQESPEDEGYSYANEDSYNMSKNKEERVNFIKQEPPEDLNVGEDTKEGILESANSSFLNPVPHPETSHFDPIPTSDSQDIWGSESRADDDYQHLEGGPPCESATEDSSQNEAEWRKTSVEKDNEKAGITLLSTQAEIASNSIEFRPLWTSFPQSGTRLKEAGRRSDSLPFCYRCQICSKIFDHKGNYRKHMMTHTGERPFECPVCIYSAAQKGNLQAHMKRIHPEIYFNTEIRNQGVL